MEKGAEPILVTPIARRLFDGQGRLMATHGAYPAAIMNLSRRRGLRCVDLENATMQAVEALGEQDSRKLFCHVPKGHPNYPDGSADNSHLCERGAALFAGLFVDLLNGDLTPESRAEQTENTRTLGALIDKEDDVLKHMEKTDLHH